MPHDEPTLRAVLVVKDRGSRSVPAVQFRRPVGDVLHRCVDPCRADLLEQQVRAGRHHHDPLKDWRRLMRSGVLATFREAPLAVKAILIGVFISRLSGFLNIFLVLYLTAKGFSTELAALALGVYGAGAIVGVLLGGAMADRLGPRNATVISMSDDRGADGGAALPALYPLLLVAVGLVSLGGQLYRPASATLLSELTPAGQQVDDLRHLPLRPQPGRDRRAPAGPGPLRHRRQQLHAAVLGRGVHRLLLRHARLERSCRRRLADADRARRLRPGRRTSTSARRPLHALSARDRSSTP